jgi:hypothetical protein
MASLSNTTERSSRPINAAPWTPWIAGAQAASAWHAVNAIADELAALLVRAPDELTAGTLGADLAVFFGYLHAATGDPSHRALAGRAIDHAGGALATSALRNALFDGFLRTGWAVEHLRRRGWIDAPDDACDELDDAMLAALDQPAHFDLMSGLAGQAVYALERAPGSPRLLAGIADRLIGAAVALSGGHAWRSDPRWLAPWQRALHPDGFFDLGLSHGTAGALRVVAELAARGIASDRVVGGAVRWQLAAEEPGLSPSGFRYFQDGARPAEPARLAWCYGDPGIAIALLDSARLLERPDWTEHGARIAGRAARVPVERAGVHDAAICHGAVGLAHTFRRLAIATGDDACQSAAERWLGSALARRRADDDGAGFFAFDVRGRGWVRDASLLTGSAGIGLALLAAITPITPAWDRLLLLSSAFTTEVAP